MHVQESAPERSNYIINLRLSISADFLNYCTYVNYKTRDKAMSLVCDQIMYPYVPKLYQTAFSKEIFFFNLKNLLYNATP